MTGKTSYCDINSFNYLPDKDRYDFFIVQLENSKSKAAHELQLALVLKIDKKKFF